MNKKILFYSSVKQMELFDSQRFYSVDIELLENLGFEVTKTNKISSFLSFWKYDISFLYFYRWSLIPAVISRFLLKKIYFTGGIDQLEESITTKKEYLLQVILFKVCYLLSDKCIVVSKSDLQNILRALKRKKLRKIYLSFHTISFDDYFLENVSGKNNHFSTIAWMENIANVKRKGIENSLILFQKLSGYSEFSDSKLFIIGKEGEGSVYLKRCCESLQISNKVVFTGSISEEEKIYILKKSKYYLQLSTFEGFGIAAIEALASKNIVIHSGNGGLNETMRDFGVRINIETDLDQTIDGVLGQLNHFNFDALFKAAMHVKDNYSNITRENDFKSIMKS